MIFETGEIFGTCGIYSLKMSSVENHTLINAYLLFRCQDSSKSLPCYKGPSHP